MTDESFPNLTTNIEYCSECGHPEYDYEWIITTTNIDGEWDDKNQRLEDGERTDTRFKISWEDYGPTNAQLWDWYHNKILRQIDMRYGAEKAVKKIEQVMEDTPCSNVSVEYLGQETSPVGSTDD